MRTRNSATSSHRNTRTASLRVDKGCGQLHARTPSQRRRAWYENGIGRNAIGFWYFRRSMSVLSRPQDVDPVDEVEHLGAEELLAYAAERFGNRLAVACSFQKENSVIVDMVSKVAPQARLFTLDTDVLFPESYETWRALEERYGRKIEVFKGMSLEEQAARHGDELWAR